MLYDPNLVVHLSRACAYNDINSVDTLANKLSDAKFMATYEGEKLKKLIEEMIVIYADRPRFERNRNSE